MAWNRGWIREPVCSQYWSQRIKEFAACRVRSTGRVAKRQEAAPCGFRFSFARVPRSPFMNHWKDRSTLKIKKLYRKEFSAYCSTIDETDPAWQAILSVQRLHREKVGGETRLYAPEPRAVRACQSSRRLKMRLGRVVLKTPISGNPNSHALTSQNRCRHPAVESACVAASCRFATQPPCRDGWATRQPVAPVNLASIQIAS